MKKQTKYIHEGHYVAEVEVELQDADSGWSPTMSLDDAYKLDDVATAARQSIVYEMKRVAG